MNENKKELLKQDKLDHDQHYDIDGVTQIGNELIIPKDFKIESHFFQKPFQLQDSITFVASDIKP